MTEEKMNKLGNILAIIVVLIACLLIWGLLVGIDVVFWIFSVMLFLFGPACFVLYLREVKRGIFKDDEES